MNRGQAFIGIAVLVLAGVVWFVFGPESCSHYNARNNRAFAEALYGGHDAEARWNEIRAQRPEGCR